MKSIYLSISYALITTLSYSQVLINEFEPNPDGADPDNVNIELKGTPNSSFSGYLLSVECDNVNTLGEIQDANAISGNFDANGLLVVTIPDLENPSFTFILTDTFTGSVGVSDIDTDNDGVVDDTSSFNTVYDAIGIPDESGDETLVYGADLGGTNFKYIGTEPFLIFRDGNSNALFAVIAPGDTEVYNTNAETIPISNFTGTPNATSFGSPNAYESTLSSKHNVIRGLKLYPNPVSGTSLTVQAYSSAAIEIAVYSLIGTLISEQKIIKNRLDISQLKTGVYILKLKQANQVSIKKLVVK